MPRELRPIAFLPWLHLRQEVKIGNVLFWPYDEMKGEYLPNRYSAEQVDKYAQVFRTTNNELAKVTCVSYTIEPEAGFAQRQVYEVQRAKHALFASSCVGGLEDPNLINWPDRYPSSEHFAWYHLPTAERISKGEWGFSYPRHLVVGVLGDGWRIAWPDYLHRCSISLCDPLLNAYREAIKLRHRHMPYVWRSLEWFFYSQSAQEHFTEEARLVHLCIAIEAAICGTPTYNGTKKFVGKIGNATAELNLPKRYVCFVDNKTCMPTRGNIVQKWAYDLYQLRSSLVHSDVSSQISVVWSLPPVPTYHHFIAPYVWFECLWHTMKGMGIIPPRPHSAGPITTESVRAYSIWYHRWHCNIEALRKWWRDFLTGKDMSNWNEP